jgi:hypothetical protein
LARVATRSAALTAAPAAAACAEEEADENGSARDDDDVDMSVGLQQEHAVGPLRTWDRTVVTAALAASTVRSARTPARRARFRAGWLGGALTPALLPVQDAADIARVGRAHSYEGALLPSTAMAWLVNPNGVSLPVIKRFGSWAKEEIEGVYATSTLL